MKTMCFIAMLAATPLWAQAPLSLQDAITLALGKNKSLEAVAAGIKAAEARITQARSGVLPKLNYTEGFTRGNNPVYVFGSLLTQHRFTMDNFQLGTLNRPDALNNFQSQVTLDQVIYDAGQTKTGVRSAELAHDMTSEDGRRVRQDIIAGVVRAYYGVVLSGESLRVARETVRSAEADLQRAEAVRSAGLSTDVDVLSIRVHLAGVKEQQIRRAADLDVARAALNEVLGVSLDTHYALSSELTPANVADVSLESYERKALAERPEARQVKLAASLADKQVSAARASLLPQVAIHTAFEADRQRFFTRGGANWLAAVSLRWNIFNGNADKARIAEAGELLHRAQAEQERTASAIRLEVRRAYADLRSAEQRIEVAKAAVDMAQESLRITQNRYQAGLANVTDLLRTETALLEARTRYLAAVYDQRVAAIMLDRAAGVV